MTKQTIKSILLVFTLFALLGTALAQIRETGQIQGYVKDDQGESLPGATLTLAGPNLLGGTITQVASHNGFYRFPSLPVGPYTVSAEIAGFAKFVREGVLLTSNKTLTVDFKLERAKMTEEVVVIGRTPTIDVTNSAPGGVVLTDEFLLNVPYVKSILAAIHMAPGIDSDNQSAYGSGQAMNNAWLIDGVNTTTTWMGGLHFRPDFNIIKEASVRGLGLPAEYGEFSGAVINIVTKSGSNTLSGMAEFNLHGKNWNSQNTGSIPAERFMYPSMKMEKYNTGDSWDLSFQVGGKIIKDRLWYMVSAEYISSRSYLLGVPYHETDRNPKLFGKLDYQINKSNRVHLSFIWQKASTDNYSMDYSTPEEITQVSRNPRYTFSGSWTSMFSPMTILDVKFGYYYQELNVLPHPGLENVPGIMDLYEGTYVNNIPFFMQTDEFRYHTTAHLSHYIADFLGGSHDLKLGGEIQYAKHGGKSGYPGGVSYYYFMGFPLMGFKEEPLYLDYYSRTIAAFAQDSWTIGKRLTINYGLRLNAYWFKNPAPDLGVLYTSSALAPRIGFAYDLFGDRKNVVKFHYGHFNDTLNIYGLDTIETRVNPTTVLEWDGAEWIESYTYTPSTTGWSVAPNAKQPYMREFVAGYARELFKNASLEVNAYHRKAMRFMGNVLMNGDWYLTVAKCPGPDGIFGNADDYEFPYYDRDYTNYQSPVWQIANVKKGMTPYVLEDPWRTQKGFEVIFNKRMANRWQLLLSYAYGTSRGNTNSLWTSLGQDPNLFTFATGKMYYYGEPHHFRIQGSVLLPWDIQLGFSGSFMSGTYYITRAYCDTPSNSQVMMDVLAVGDGKRADDRKNFDLRLEKQFRLGGARLLTVMANINNVLNFHGVDQYYYMYGPRYGKIWYLQEPRVFSVAARFFF